MIRAQLTSMPILRWSHEPSVELGCVLCSALGWLIIGSIAARRSILGSIAKVVRFTLLVRSTSSAWREYTFRLGRRCLLKCTRTASELRGRKPLDHFVSQPCLGLVGDRLGLFCSVYCRAFERLGCKRRSHGLGAGFPG